MRNCVARANDLKYATRYALSTATLDVDPTVYIRISRCGVQCAELVTCRRESAESWLISFRKRPFWHLTQNEMSQRLPRCPTVSSPLTAPPMVMRPWQPARAPPPPQPLPPPQDVRGNSLRIRPLQQMVPAVPVPEIARCPLGVFFRRKARLEQRTTPKGSVLFQLIADVFASAPARTTPGSRI